jgi:hypothetical protein
MLPEMRLSPRALDCGPVGMLSVRMGSGLVAPSRR